MKIQTTKNIPKTRILGREQWREWIELKTRDENETDIWTMYKENSKN